MRATQFDAVKADVLDQLELVFDGELGLVDVGVLDGFLDDAGELASARDRRQVGGGEGGGGRLDEGASFHKAMNTHERRHVLP